MFFYNLYDLSLYLFFTYIIHVLLHFMSFSMLYDILLISFFFTLDIRLGMGN
jgi:hypothetical protein